MQHLVAGVVLLVVAGRADAVVGAGPTSPVFGTQPSPGIEDAGVRPVAEEAPAWLKLERGARVRFAANEPRSVELFELQGERVRVTRTAIRGRMQGRAWALDANRLLVEPEKGMPVVVPLHSVRALELSVGRRGHVRKGLLIAGLAGGLAGCFATEPACTDARSVARSAGIWALTGGVIGALHRTDRWRPVAIGPLPPVRAAELPAALPDSRPGAPQALQGGVSRPLVAPGTRVRVIATGLGQGWVKGIVLEASEREIVVSPSSGDMRHVPVAGIARLEISVGRRRRAGVGFLLGAALGGLAAVAGGCPYMSSSPTAGERLRCARITAPMFGGMGALVGAGAIDDRWIVVLPAKNPGPSELQQPPAPGSRGGWEQR